MTPDGQHEVAGEPGSASDAQGPVRTCVGCRGREAQARLLRIAVADGYPQIDIQRRLPGRGAYVHPHQACVERATRKGRLGRALRIPLNPSHTSALRRLVVEGAGLVAGLEGSTRGSRSECSSEPSQRSPRGPEDGNGTDIRRTDREMNWLTRPQRQFVDETRQAKGQ